MARQPIKTISVTPEKLIPKSHLADKTLREDAPDIKDRPLVFYVRKMSRDEHFKVREMLELKDDLKPEKGIIGSGNVAKYIWETNVTEVRNVVVEEAGNVATFESLTGKAKDDLWNTEGMDSEIGEAILFARTTSQLDEAEAKN